MSRTVSRYSHIGSIVLPRYSLTYQSTCNIWKQTDKYLLSKYPKYDFFALLGNLGVNIMLMPNHGVPKCQHRKTSSQWKHTCVIGLRCPRLDCQPACLFPILKGDNNTIQVYSATVMTHVIALEAGHSSQGTS